MVTNARIFKTPTPLEEALAAVRGLIALPNLYLLAEGDGYFEKLHSLASTARIQGSTIHDARVAALCLYHGVTELWSADRDSSRFPALKVSNPLTG